MRARGRFGMVLNGENRELTMPHALDGSVIQIDVSYLQVRRTQHALITSFEAESVVLGRDQYAVS